ncbi:MAG: exo-alpha-sialidase [Lentisphaerae bacterium]|nr:exo-alpha-sialidase [Lentisphaerota bacterium]
MTNIECLKSGLIYRNPKPHVRSIHAYFPSVVALSATELLATFVLGEAFEAANLQVNIARSLDGGETWRLEGPLPVGTLARPTSNTGRITVMENGEIVAFVIRHDRSRLEEGFANPRNLGFIAGELLIVRSRDGGRTWSPPATLAPPLVGPEFEMCCPIIPLRDGRWLLPTSTWRNWDGHCPNGMKAVALVSRDRGLTWPEYVDVMADPQREIIYWESKVLELPDGRLLAVAWAYDEKRSSDLPNQYALSVDGGKTFSRPRSMELQGQTLTSIALDDGRILSVYRRTDKPGLWANVSRLKGDSWINESELPLWGVNLAGLMGTSANMAQNFAVLRFGAPCLTRLANGDSAIGGSLAELGQAASGGIFAACWCVEDCVSNIRYFYLRLRA